MMSRYPSSADPVDARSASMGARYPDTATLAAFRALLADVDIHPWADGAWQRELRHGVGYRLTHRGNLIYSAHEPGCEARREASSLRSRAYARGIGSLADRETFAPSPWAAPFLDIPHPTVSTDTWTEDDVRHPLPITYHAAFTITR